MRRFVSGALVALFSFSYAGAHDLVKPSVTMLLYPQGQEVDCGIVENGVHVTMGPGESNGLSGEMTDDGMGRLGNIGDQADIRIYLPRRCNGQMVVICPGGGYSIVASLHEGAMVADWCVRRGIAACVVDYRMPNSHSMVPLQDVQNAFRYCRSHAAEWGVSRIGVLGFSAGGHLAASASNLWVDDVTRPDFSVLIYPVISFSEGFTHEGTCKKLTGGRKSLYDRWSMENQVSIHTPPTILFLSADDTAVPPQNSIVYFQAMQRAGVPGELHILSHGGHGWGFGPLENSAPDPLGDQREVFCATLERWLKSQR